MRRGSSKKLVQKKRPAPAFGTFLLDPRLRFFSCYFFLLVFGNLFLFAYLTQERTIYSWDFSCYEFKFVEAVEAFRAGPFHFLKAVLSSIAHTDNSLLIPAWLAPWGAALGIDRAHFQFLVFNLLAAPSLLVLSLLFSRLAGSAKYDLAALLPAALALLNPFFWIPLVRGFYDIALWLGMILVWALVLGDGKKIPWGKVLAVGVGLTVLIFMRRWMGYWSLSLPLALGLVWVWARVRGERTSWGPGSIALVCGAGALTFLLFAPHLMSHALTQDHSALHEAYKRGLSTFQSAWKGFAAQGLLAWAFAGAGALWAWKKGPFRPFITLALLQSLLALVFFARVQNLDAHHQAPFVLVLVLFQSLFLLFLWKGAWTLPVKAAATTFFVLGTCLNFLQPLVPGASFLPSSGRLLVEERAPPLRRGDLAQIQRLIGYLGTQGQASKGIYVLSGSQEFNATTLQNAPYYLRFQDQGVCSKVQFTSTVDVRDGFPWGLFEAGLVLVAAPPQFQLREQDQGVIALPARALLEGKGIGKAFLRSPLEFQLDGGVTVKVYRRVGKIKFSDVEALNDALREAHPDSSKFSKGAFLAGR